MQEIPVQDFFIANMFTDLQEGELIESVSIDREPFQSDRMGMAFVELKRAAQTFPTVSGPAVVRVADANFPDSDIENACLTLANTSDVPLGVDVGSDELEDEPLTEAAAETGKRAASEAADPIEEMHADEEFKIEVAGEYGRRAIETAYERATSRFPRQYRAPPQRDTPPEHDRGGRSVRIGLP